MTSADANLNHYWSRLIISELDRQGVRYFNISPGSRSTPLTVAAARHPQAKTTVFYDERAAAYHALGYARACGKPAVLICTSGTAAANYFPAVIEAAQDDIPLIILSADRPPELRDSGANQTIDQVKLFGTYVRWFFDMPTPSENIPPQFVLSTVDKLVYRASKGPVHLNCMFREPLAPVAEDISDSYKRNIENWEQSSRPYTVYENGYFSAEPETLQAIAARLRESANGLVLLGRLPAGQNRQVIGEFVQKLGWPVFADITSGFRLTADTAPFIPYYDLLLTAEKPHFNSIVHLGGRFVSKKLLQLFETQRPDRYYHICASEQTINPALAVTQRLHISPDQFCRQLLPLLTQNENNPQTEKLRKKSAVVDSILTEILEDGTTLSQPALNRELSRLIPEHSGLFLASSLPVREMNWFAGTGKDRLAVAANRGASGIDGTIASASGFAAGLERPVTLLIGDLALLHDLNSLLILKNNEQPVIVIVENNQGGGIFHFLPIAEFDAVFESFFATPHQLNFENAAKMFDLPYFTAQTLAELRDVYQQALETRRSVLIEAATGRRENAELHKTILQQIKERL